MRIIADVYLDETDKIESIRQVVDDLVSRGIDVRDLVFPDEINGIRISTKYRKSPPEEK